MSVEYKGKEYRVKKGRGESSRITLDLSGRGITEISEIRGLETITDLHVLKLNNNNIVEIKGLETVGNLIQLELKDNQITEIKGLENLVYLEELDLRGNNIEIIKGLDTLENLHWLNLYGNRISQLESFQNKEKLSAFIFSGPLCDQVKNTFGSANSQNLMKFSQMSDSKRNSIAQITREKNRVHRLEQETQMKRRKSSNALCECIVFIIVGIVALIVYLLTGYRLPI